MSSSAKPSPTSFSGEAGTAFRSHYNKIRGYVRQELARRYLKPYLPLAGSKVLDFGGGWGDDTFWLADLGYDVKLLDESSDYVDEARSRLKAAPAATQRRIKVSLGGTETLTDNTETYDLVLSHAVLMYAHDPLEQLQALTRVLKSGGVISLLTKSLTGAKVQAQHYKKTKDLKSLENDGTYFNNLGVQARAFSRLQIESMLKRNGFELLEWNGVRTLISTDEDHRKVREVNTVELRQIVEAEFRAGQSHEKEQAQMLHFIARKN